MTDVHKALRSVLPKPEPAPKPEEPSPVHEHHWENGPVMKQSRVSRSPCSASDDHLWTEIIQVQTCACGETRRLLLGFENRRRRGDDRRRAIGKAPLGTPLQESGIYKTPKVLR